MVHAETEALRIEKQAQIGHALDYHQSTVCRAFQNAPDLPLVTKVRVWMFALEHDYDPWRREVRLDGELPVEVRVYRRGSEQEKERYVCTTTNVSVGGAAVDLPPIAPGNIERITLRYVGAPELNFSPSCSIAWAKWNDSASGLRVGFEFRDLDKSQRNRLQEHIDQQRSAGKLSRPTSGGISRLLSRGGHRDGQPKANAKAGVDR